MASRDEKKKSLEDFLLQYEGNFVHGARTDLDSSPSSGWKLHVYGESVTDSSSIFRALGHFLKEYQLSYKLATGSFYQHHPPTDRQYGKAATIYLPMMYIHNREIFDLIPHINELLRDSGYSKSGEITGDKHYGGSIHYRYEMKIPMLYEGFNNEFYLANYRENDGNYNIESNSDLFYFFNKRE